MGQSMSQYTGDALNILYLILVVGVIAVAGRIFGSRPFGIVGDAVAAIGFVAVAAYFYNQRMTAMLVELDDRYPTYFQFAYMPILAFIALGFLRSVAQFLPARGPTLAPAGQAMAMTSVDQERGAGPSPAGGPPAQAPAAESKTTSWMQIAIGVAFLIIIGLTVVSKFMTSDKLPSCDSRITLDILSDIFQKKSVDVKRYDGFTTRSADKDLVACTAAMTMGDNSKADLDYEITRTSDSKVQVKITGARDKK